MFLTKGLSCSSVEDEIESKEKIKGDYVMQYPCIELSSTVVATISQDDQ